MGYFNSANEILTTIELIERDIEYHEKCLKEDSKSYFMETFLCFVLLIIMVIIQMLMEKMNALIVISLCYLMIIINNNQRDEKLRIKEHDRFIIKKKSEIDDLRIKLKSIK